jgi:hypothetical protein
LQPSPKAVSEQVLAVAQAVPSGEFVFHPPRAGGPLFLIDNFIGGVWLISAVAAA